MLLRTIYSATKLTENANNKNELIHQALNKRHCNQQFGAHLPKTQRSIDQHKCPRVSCSPAEYCRRPRLAVRTEILAA